MSTEAASSTAPTPFVLTILLSGDATTAAATDATTATNASDSSPNPSAVPSLGRLVLPAPLDNQSRRESVIRHIHREMRHSFHYDAAVVCDIIAEYAATSVLSPLGPTPEPSDDGGSH
jgi:hypothetical protein